VIFLGASIAYKRGAHMGLHFITEKTSTPVKRLLSIISLLLSSVFFIFIGVEGVMVTLKMTTQLTPAMEVSMAWQFSAIPVGAFLMLLHVPGLLTQSEKAGVPHDLDSSM
jgi:TRAP-type C4-dicarboxylate transport system permease small subunit